MVQEMVEVVRRVVWEVRWEVARREVEALTRQHSCFKCKRAFNLLGGVNQSCGLLLARGLEKRQPVHYCDSGAPPLGLAQL